MTFLLRDLLREPMALAIVAASILAVVVSRTRHAKWIVVASPLLLWLCTAPGQFDGERHLNAKLDATAFVWISCVELRALGSLALLLLAAPIGAAAARLAGVRNGALSGLAVVAPFAVGLLASSMLLLRTAQAIATGQALVEEEKLALLRAAIGSSEQLVATGTVVSLLACVVIAITLVRRT